MKLTYSHTGKKFFFITLALEDRPQVLSRLVDEESRPQLTRLGEVVKAALVAVHAVFPAAAISNFVIMPDHLHFILIVDYAHAPDFNPLWVSHTLMDAIEAGWEETQKTRGQAPEPPVPGMVAILRQALEEAHFIASEINRLKREQGLSRAAALTVIARTYPAVAMRFLRNPRLASFAAAAQGFGGRAPEVCGIPRFDRRAYIMLAFTAPMLRTIRRYIKLNPARALWKRRHPDRFLRFANIRHPVLDAARTWSAMGNLALLASPFLLHVRLTLKKSVAEHEASIREILDKARHGSIPVSGFISPGEVELLKRLKAEPGTRFIRLLPCSLPPRYDPSAEDSRELAADRLLLLSGFDNTTPHISANDMRHDPAAAHQFRANCLAMNDLAAAICTKAAEIY